MTSTEKIQLAETLAHLMDDQFQVGPFKFGLDPLIGLIPGLGDAIPGLLGLYLLYVGISENIPRKVLIKMLLYFGVDVFIGSIPILGDIFDFAFKPFTKNLALLKQAIAQQQQ